MGSGEKMFYLQSTKNNFTVTSRSSYTPMSYSTPPNKLYPSPIHHRTVVLSSLLCLRSIITARMVSTGEKGKSLFIKSVYKLYLIKF